MESVRMFEDEMRRRAAQLTSKASDDAAAASREAAEAEAAALATWSRVKDLGKETARVLATESAVKVAVAELRPWHRLRLLGYGWNLKGVLITEDGRLFTDAGNLPGLKSVNNKGVVCSWSTNPRAGSYQTEVYSWGRRKPGHVANTALPTFTAEQWRSLPGTIPTACASPHQGERHLTGGSEGTPVICNERVERDSPAWLERDDLREWILNASAQLLADTER